MTRRVRVLVILLALAIGVMFWQEDTCSKRVAKQRSLGEIDTLIEELQSWNTCVRAAAAFDLQKTGLSGADALPQLTRRLTDFSSLVRWRAAAALGHIGIAAPEVIRALIAALQDDNPHVRFNAIFSLAELSSPEAARPMAALITDPVPETRHSAIYNLRFVALPGDREWLCPALGAALVSGNDGWLAAAETAGLLGCIDLISNVENVRARWMAQCPTATIEADDKVSKSDRRPWAVSLATGRGCETVSMTLHILSLTVRRLSVRKTLEQGGPSSSRD